MIEFFRRNRRGIVGLFIVSMCGLMMVPFGLDQLNSQSQDPVVAIVGKKEIRMSEYLRDYSRVRSMFAKQFGAQFDQFESMLNLKQRVLDDMVDKTLLNDFFSTLGLSASKSQVEAAVRALPAFANGVSRLEFENFLSNQGITESYFLSEMKESLIEKQLTEVFENSGAIGPLELSKRYDKLQEKIGIDYIKIPEQKPDSPITANEISEYYEKNKEMYVTTRSVLPLIVNLKADSYRSKVVIDESDVVTAYENSGKKFEVPRKLKIDQIRFTSSKNELAKMVNSAENAADNTEQIRALSESAREKLLADSLYDIKLLKSQGASVSFGESLVDESSLPEEVQAVVKSLSKGDVSEVSESNSDFLIVRVVDLVDSYKRPITEVRSILEEEIKANLAPEYALVSAESIIKKLENEDPIKLPELLKQEAEKNNAEVLSIDQAISRESKPTLIKDKGLVDFITELPAGALKLYNNSSLGDITIVYAKQAFEVRTKSLEESSLEITKSLERKKIDEATKLYAESVLKELKESINLNPEQTFRDYFKTKKFEVLEIAPDKISSLSIPFIQNPQEKNLVIGELRSSKFSNKVIKSLDGFSYILGLGKVEKITKATDNKTVAEEQIKLLEGAKNNAGVRLNKILLDQLKLQIKPEVRSELLPK